MADGRSYTRGNIGNHIYATGTHSVVFANGRDASMHSWKQYEPLFCAICKYASVFANGRCAFLPGLFIRVVFHQNHQNFSGGFWGNLWFLMVFDFFTLVFFSGGLRTTITKVSVGQYHDYRIRFQKICVDIVLHSKHV